MGELDDRKTYGSLCSKIGRRGLKLSITSSIDPDRVCTLHIHRHDGSRMQPAWMLDEVEAVELMDAMARAVADFRDHQARTMTDGLD
jgi:hypothetical protein